MNNNMDIPMRNIMALADAIKGLRSEIGELRDEVRSLHAVDAMTNAKIVAINERVGLMMARVIGGGATGGD